MVVPLALLYSSVFFLLPHGYMIILTNISYNLYRITLVEETLMMKMVTKDTMAIEDDDCGNGGGNFGHGGDVEYDLW
jgi:hypothetical protein